MRAPTPPLLASQLLLLTSVLIKKSPGEPCAATLETIHTLPPDAAMSLAFAPNVMSIHAKPLARGLLPFPFQILRSALTAQGTPTSSTAMAATLPGIQTHWLFERKNN